MKTPKKSPTTILLWIIYLFLLAVLMPHTAWAFRAFEPAESWVIFGIFTSADLVAYIAALAFEASIAVLTHKLSAHIEQTQKEAKRLDEWGRIKLRYFNAYFAGLLIATIVSSLANLAHAIQFGASLAIFAAWGIPSAVYVVAFGGILPVVSLLFARVLSNVNESETTEEPALTEAKVQIVDLRRQLREAKEARDTADALRMDAYKQAKEADARFAAAGDLMRALTADDKRVRILAVRQQWPQLTGSAIAVMVGASPSYVSEIINGEIVNA
jgi:hypothetical protein